MVGPTNEMWEDVSRQQLESVIDDELQKVEFASLCKKIALKVVERVHKIDQEHNEIKSLYAELGSRMNFFVTDCPTAENLHKPNCLQTISTINNGNKRECNGIITSDVIMIDDDDNDATASAAAGSAAAVTDGDNKVKALDSHGVEPSGLLKTVSPLPCTDINEKLINSNSVTDNVNSVTDNVSTDDKDVGDTGIFEKEASTLVINDKSAPLPSPSSSASVSTSEKCELISTTAGENMDISGSGMEKNNIDGGGDTLDPNLHEDNEVAENNLLFNDPMPDANVVAMPDANVVAMPDANVVASVENALSPNTLTNTAVTQLDISEPDIQSVIYDDDALQTRSPLILKLTATETHKTAKTQKYSSTIVSPDTNDLISVSQRDTASTSSMDVEASSSFSNEIEVPSIPSSHTEASSSSSNVRRVKRKPFKFEAGSIVYAKPCGSDIWYEAELLKEIFGSGKKQPKYQVRFLGGQRLRQKILLKSIATKDPADNDQFELGTRIVAGRPSDTVNTSISKKYKDISSGNNINVMFAGIVAELACEANRYRYLIFFDDGYAQYFNITSIFLVIRPSRDVWNDVATDCQEFVKEYLQEYPFRPLLCTKINSSMQTEWNGEWWKSKVVSIDASLLKMLFDVDKRSEWIYRGTTRLEPLYDYFSPPNPKKKKKITKPFSDSYVDEKITHPSFGISRYSMKDPHGKQQRAEWDIPVFNLKRVPSSGPTPVFAINNKTTDDQEKDKVMPKKLRVQSGIEGSTVEKEIEISTISSQEAFGVLGALNTSPTNGSAAAKTLILPSDKICDKSAKNNVLPSAKVTLEAPPVVVSFLPTKIGPHTCDASCIKERRKIINEVNIGIFNYLSIPFKLGWKRESSRKKTGWHRDIYYRTPCNKRIRNLSEVTTYLSLTKCLNVAIDMFCFYPSISCRNQTLRPKPTLAKIDDLSGGKETCPIVCVNEINEDLPNPIVYISHRLPAEDVYINTDPGFLVCCDCVDNCQDKTKCGCAQLTVGSSNAIDDVVDANAGYQYRRLKETITTGIYECNQNCSCSRETCYNRVVQNGIQLRLQVFMTENRGWGVRCVNDIPRGTFICTYTGQVLNEQTANKEGIDFGDEYLAELDHIEVVEKAKDDYESDVPELRDNITISSDDDSDSDSSSSVLSISSDSSDDDKEDALEKTEVVDKLHENEEPVPFAPDTEVSKEPIDSAPPEIDHTNLAGEPNNEVCHVPLLKIQTITDNVSGKASPISSKNEDFVSSSLQSVVNIEVNPISNDISSNVSLGAPGEDDKAVNSGIAVHDTQADLGISRLNLARKSGSSVGKAGKLATNVISKKKESINLSTRSLYNRDKQMYVIDAKCFGNVGRFMNHSCSPNLFVQNVMVDTHDLRFPWVAFFAQQNIQAYTELTWDYNYEIGSVPDKILTCKCGSKNCKGRLL